MVDTPARKRQRSSSYEINQENLPIPTISKPQRPQQESEAVALLRDAVSQSQGLARLLLYAIELLEEKRI